MVRLPFKVSFCFHFFSWYALSPGSLIWIQLGFNWCLCRTWLDVLGLDWRTRGWHIAPCGADWNLWDFKSLQHRASCHSTHWSSSSPDVQEGRFARLMTVVETCHFATGRSVWVKERIGTRKKWLHSTFKENISTYRVWSSRWQKVAQHGRVHPWANDEIPLLQQCQGLPCTCCGEPNFSWVFNVPPTKCLSGVYHIKKNDMSRINWYKLYEWNYGVTTNNLRHPETGNLYT